MKKIILNLLIIITIIFCFGKLYFSKYSFGARGDDSAGYIFNAGRLFIGEKTIYKDEVVKRGLDFFKETTTIEFLIPNHSYLINSDGTITSKYTLGISYLMNFFGKIFKSDLAFYYLNPFFAILVLVLTYFLVIFLFQSYKFKYLVALLSVFMLGFSYRFIDGAIAQPMREMTFTFFLLLASLFLVIACYKKNPYFLIITATSLGVMILIRSTGFIFLPIFLFLAWKNEILKQKIIIIFTGILLITLLPLASTSLQISFKKNISDVYKSRFVALPDIEHLKSLNLKNIFISSGKFQPAEPGGLRYYHKVIETIAPFPFFIFLVFLGFLALWRYGSYSEERRFIGIAKNPTGKTFFWVFLLNILSYLILFSAWINPYPRYILPIFPFLTIMASFGFIYLFAEIVPSFFSKKIEKIFLSLLILFTFFGYYYGHYFFLKDYYNNFYKKTRAISKNDFLNLKDLGKKISGQKSILIFTDYYKHGLSETFQTHTNVRAIRTPYLEDNTVIPKEKTKKFLKNMANDYDLYLWFDKTSDEKSNELFFENFILEKKFIYRFSWTNQDIIIYKITNKT